MATATAGYEGDYPLDVEEDRASGWVSFAAIMLGFAGAWNAFDGILALANSKVYVANTTFVFSDLRTWGWIILVVGIAEIGAAFAILSGNQLGRWFGVGAASVNAIAQLMFIPAAPFWALCMFAIDLLVIYGLAVYGGRAEAA
jgi:hypothetical protein